MSVDELFNPKCKWLDVLRQWHFQLLSRVLQPDLHERVDALLKRPYSEVSESDCIELLKEVHGTKGDDTDAFVSFSQLHPIDFDSYRMAKTFLDKHPEIRQRRPSKQRLEVHAGDWFRCVATRPFTKAEIEKVHEGYEERKEEVRQKRKRK